MTLKGLEGGENDRFSISVQPVGVLEAKSKGQWHTAQTDAVKCNSNEVLDMDQIPRKKRKAKK